MLLCTLALFAVSLGYGVVVPLLPQLTAEPAGAQAASAISVIYAVYAAAKIGAQVPGGAWVDAAGGRKVLRVGLTLFSISLAGFFFRGGVVWFALVRALEGAATGLVYPAVFALVLLGSSERGSGKRIGMAVGVGSSGLLAGPALGGWLAPYGAHVPVLIALIVSAALTLAVLLPSREERDARDALHANNLNPNIRHPNDLAARARPMRTIGSELRSIGQLAASAGFFGLCLPVAFNKLTFSSFQGLLPLHGPAAFGLGTRGVTMLFALTGVVFALAQPLGGVLVDRFSARTVALALTPPLLLSLAAMAWTPNATAFAWAWGSYVGASSIIFTATLKHAARAFGTEETYGGVFGVLGTLTDLMTIAGPLLFLNLYPRLGANVFLAMAAIGVPFALGYLLLTRGRALGLAAEKLGYSRAMTLPSGYVAAAALEERLGDPRDAKSVLSFAASVALDERDEFPQPQLDALNACSYMHHVVPRSEGGLFESFESAAALQRALSRRDLTCAIAVGQSFLGSIAVWLAGTKEQRARTSALLLRGEPMALALTEEEHGSDVLATGTQAEKIGGGYSISGRKWLINNGTRAAAYSLFARTEGEGGLHGQSLFLLEKSTLREGALKPLAKIRTQGIRGADISGFVLDHAEVSPQALLGSEGSGAELLLKSLQVTRVGCAAFSLGAADSALRLSLDFATTRELYGAKLIDLPHARAELLDAFLDLLVCDAAALAGSRAVQAAPEQLSLWSSAIKFFVPITCDRSIATAARVLGARHYLREQFASGAFQKLLRDAAVVSLFDGSTAVNLDGAGTQLLRLSPARAATPGERERVLSELFSLGGPLPPLDGSRLQLVNGGRCDITQGLPEARAALEKLQAEGGLAPEIAGTLFPLLLALEEELAKLLGEIANLQTRARAEVKRSPELFAHAGRYCELFAASCAVHAFARNRGCIDAFFDEGAWLVLILDRMLFDGGRGRRAGIHPLSPRLVSRLLELHASERAFALLPLQLGRGEGKRS